MKVATFTVRADVRQSARWKQAAEAEGFASVGAWLSGAADAYLKEQARAGRPLPLAWRRAGRFTVQLQDGRGVELPGRVSPPFGIFRGTAAGAGIEGCHRHTLVYVPSGRILATLRTEAQCKALGAELARAWVRLGGHQPAEDSVPVIERHRREAF